MSKDKTNVEMPDLTNARWARLKQTAVEGTYPRGSGLYKTRGILEDHGLLRWSKVIGDAVLTPKGADVVRAKWPDLDFQDVSDPFDAPNLGIAQASIDRHLEIKRLQAEAAASRDAVLSERKVAEELVFEMFEEAVGAVLSPLGFRPRVKITRCATTTAGGAPAFCIQARVGAALAGLPTEECVEIQREAFIRTRGELQTFCNGLIELVTTATAMALAVPEVEGDGAWRLEHGEGGVLLAVYDDDTDEGKE